jgi:hypothetical protein
MYVGGNDESRELSRKQISGNNAHGRQQDQRNDSDEYIGNDEAIAQPPHKVPGKGAISKDKQRTDERQHRDPIEDGESMYANQGPPGEDHGERDA